jgi:DNA mismatch repair protein MutL
LKLSVLRHATSKLRSVEDLEKISTLGFRGEALPSVAAVSELTLLTRPREMAESSTAFELTAAPDGTGSAPVRETTFGHFLGSPHGTRLQARGLFAQIPARLKFLKSQASEVGQVREWMERLALTRPDVGFRLSSDGRVVLNLRAPAPGTSLLDAEKDRVRAILADGEDYPILTFHEEGDLQPGIQVRAHWVQGLSTPQTRKMLQIVNGRAVRDRLIQQALLHPFRQALLPGQFPGVLLRVDLDPSLLDVNVHPAKTEVRFLESGRIFKAVETAVSSLIARHGIMGFAAGSRTREEDVPLQSQSPFASSTWRAQDPTPFAAKTPAHFESPTTTYRQQALELDRGSLFQAQPTAPGFTTWSETPLAGSPSQSPLPLDTLTPQRESPLAGSRFAGILFNTYLLYERGGELALIDQHAAHERIRYEKLRLRVTDPARAAAPQQLLLPEAVTFNPDSRPELEARLALLSELGFEAEIFGENSLLFRAIPGEWGTDELRVRLRNLVDRLLDADAAQPDQDARALLLDEDIFERIASEACHSAIRAGDRLDREEAERMVEQLFACAHPWNCPHGRPTLVKVPKGRFEEWFQRRV